VNAVRSRLAAIGREESGVTLVEVMVAMFIFALISMGVLFTLVQSMSFVKDSNARSAATNLAAQEIDRARATSDVFKLGDDSYTATVDGRVFTVVRTSLWVSNAAQDVPCGAGGGSLQYKKINVSVSWPGMLNQAVRSDTLLAPTSRISEPDRATILVSALDEQNVGIKDVTITVTPSLGATTPVTDAQGCAYLLRVVPGIYVIKVKKTDFVDRDQVAEPTKTVVVGAGGTDDAQFTLDQKETLDLRYASVTTAIPKNLDTSLLRGTDTVRDFPATTDAKARSLLLYPFASGYTPLAGKYRPSTGPLTGCLSPNPADWQPGMVGSVNYIAQAPGAVTPPATVQVGMGTVTVTAVTIGQSIVAVAQKTGPPGTGDPGCALNAPTYTFNNILVSAQTMVALPYGSWKLYYGTSAAGTQIPPANLAVSGAPSTVDATGILTLDPRIVAP
jgi:prepilin-type N-terminal cleavage/methylation domain-containing protein